MNATSLLDPVEILENALCAVTLLAECVRAVMARQINRLHMEPHVRQAFGFSILAPGIGELFLKHFPDSRKPAILKVLRWGQFAIVGLAVVAIMAMDRKS